MPDAGRMGLIDAGMCYERLELNRMFSSQDCCVYCLLLACKHVTKGEQLQGAIPGVIACRAYDQEKARGQSAFELELWVENMVQLGKGTTKFGCPWPLHFFSLNCFECHLAQISLLLHVLAARSSDLAVSSAASVLA